MQAHEAESEDLGEFSEAFGRRQSIRVDSIGRGGAGDHGESSLLFSIGRKVARQSKNDSVINRLTWFRANKGSAARLFTGAAFDIEVD